MANQPRKKPSPKTSSTKYPKLIWALYSEDTDLKTYSVTTENENTLLGWVDVSYYEGRIDGRSAVPKYNDTNYSNVSSRKEANEYLWKVHQEQELAGK